MFQHNSTCESSSQKVGPTNSIMAYKCITKLIIYLQAFFCKAKKAIFIIFPKGKR